MSDRLFATYFGHKGEMIKIYVNSRFKDPNKLGPFELLTDDKIDMIIDNEYKFSARFEKLSDIIQERDIDDEEDPADQDENIHDSNMDDLIDDDESRDHGSANDQILKTLKFAGVRIIEDDS